jgi:transcription elongation factor Elf1
VQDCKFSEIITGGEVAASRERRKDILRPVPNYAVYYGFTCPACAHKNAMRETTVLAENKTDAASTAYAKAKCLKCGKSLPPGNRFTTEIREL